jgi:CRP/FNR family transcriptional regulator, nitrogen fixation regulation protein
MLPQPAVGTSIRSNSIRQMPQASSQPVGAERNALAQSMQMMGAVMSFPRNSEIFGENEPADYVYRVIGGSVRTYKILSDGRRQVGGFYLPGDIFGLEFAEEHTFSAEAITDAKVVVVKRNAITALPAATRRSAASCLL